MTMKRRLSLTGDPAEKVRLEIKLAEYGLTVADGERIHSQMISTLVDENSFFTNLGTFLGADSDVKVISFASVLWPEFEFKATIDTDGGRLESARYWHTGATAGEKGVSPRGVAKWGADLDEFTAWFGPLKRESVRPIFDNFLPAYEEHRFEWNGRDYGAGFCWGLFMFASQIWD